MERHTWIHTISDYDSSSNKSLFKFYREKGKEKEQQTALVNSKNIYAQAKLIVDKLPNVTDNELLKAKDLLSTGVLSGTPEYQEAQKQLPQVNKLAIEINKKREKIAQEKAKEEKKKEKEKEEAGLNGKGKRLRAKHPEWSLDDVDSISRGSIQIGMNKEQVAAAWGRPYKVNKSVGSYGTHEQWVMHEYGNTYVYFEDGICTSMQGVK